MQQQEDDNEITDATTTTGIPAKCYYCGVDLSFDVDNEDDNFWSCDDCLRELKKEQEDKD